MADRRATNKYYPPEWEPSKGGINKFRNSHPLRDRARKLKDGIMVVRFELAFNIWCEGTCKSMLAKGVRFNAEKSKIGEYFTTPIWQFSMKCPRCSQRIIIKTDPATRDYVIESGARKKVEEYEFDKEDHAIKLMQPEEREKLNADPLHKIEHDDADVTYARGVMDPIIEGIKKLKDENYKNDYATSKLARKMLREDKKSTLADVSSFATKYGDLFNTEDDDGKMKLMKLNEEEETKAKVVQFQSNQAALKQVAIRQGSIFAKQPQASSSSIPSSSSSTLVQQHNSKEILSQVDQLKIMAKKTAQLQPQPQQASQNQLAAEKPTVKISIERKTRKQEGKDKEAPTAKKQKKDTTKSTPKAASSSLSALMSSYDDNSDNEAS